MFSRTFQRESSYNTYDTVNIVILQTTGYTVITKAMIMYYDDCVTTTTYTKYIYII